MKSEPQVKYKVYLNRGMKPADPKSSGEHCRIPHCTILKKIYICSGTLIRKGNICMFIERKLNGRPCYVTQTLHSILYMVISKTLYWGERTKNVLSSAVFLWPHMANPSKRLVIHWCRRRNFNFQVGYIIKNHTNMLHVLSLQQLLSHEESA